MLQGRSTVMTVLTETELTRLLQCEMHLERGVVVSRIDREDISYH